MQMVKPDQSYVFEQVGKGVRVKRRYPKYKLAGGTRTKKHSIRRIHRQQKEIAARQKEGGFRL